MTHFNLPQPQPTELVDSVLLRVARMNGFGSVPQLCADVLNEKACGSKRILTKKMATVMARLYGWSIQRVFQRHTLIPFLEAFSKGEIEWSARLETRRVGTCGPEQARAVRFCKKCLGEDRGWFGYSFFRRHHQISSTDICSKHLEPLFAVETDAQSVLPTDETFSALNPLVVRSGDETLTGNLFRSVAEDLLDIPSPNNIGNVGRRLRELARVAGFATGQPSTVKARSLGYEILNRPGTDGDWIRTTLAQAAYGANPAIKINNVLSGVDRNTTTVILTALSLTKCSDEAARLLVDRTPVVRPDRKEPIPDTHLLHAYLECGRSYAAAARLLGRNQSGVRERILRLLDARSK